jgi:hypothetical protein
MEIVPKGVGTVTAGWDGQLLVNAKPFALGRNGLGSATVDLLNRASADPGNTHARVAGIPDGSTVNSAA